MILQEYFESVFNQLYQFKIDMEGMILKPKMIIAGTESIVQNAIGEVAEATVNCPLVSVLAAMPAITFLSGGQSPEDAAAHLNSMHTLSLKKTCLELFRFHLQELFNNLP